jgi:hypothetical protein
MKFVIPVLSRRTLVRAVAAISMLPSIVRAQTPLMRIRIKFHDHDFTATLYDNVSARDFATMLPLDLEISDFANNEKIAYLPRKLNDEARGPFPNAAAGDLCYYIPWGNLALFYDGYESTSDLVRLGRLDGGVEPLLTRGEYPMRIERL